MRNRKTLEDLELKGSRALIRVDFNVPLDGDGNITDDTRIRSVLPSINHVLDSGGRVVLMSHLGRPRGEAAPELSLRPVARRLSRLLHQEVVMAPDCVGEEVAAMAAALPPGGVLMLENLRFHREETSNDEGFARALASLGDVYVDDAFATAHRRHASVVGVPSFLRPAVAGYLMQQEINYFVRALEEPVRPVAAILGGAKVSDKIKAIMRLLDRVDKIIVGGGMAFTFLRAMGYNVGRSLVEEEMLPLAEDIMRRAREKGVPFYLPVDAVAAPAVDAKAPTHLVPVQEIPGDEMGLDIGPASVTLFSQALADARTIVWNGPMGVFEMAPFSKGTMAVVDMLASSRGLTIIGGGDTDVAVHASGKSGQMGYISTGGGAFLKLMEEGNLPGIEVLDPV